MSKIYLNQQEPVIYLRYYKDDLMYIGETYNIQNGRPFRQEQSAGDWDKCRILKSCIDVDRRRYWEAVLVCKLKPAMQKVTPYLRKIKKHVRAQDEVKEKITKEKRLDEMREKNNRERLRYWLDQCASAKKHLEESKKCALHFYLGYKKDLENKKHES